MKILIDTREKQPYEFAAPTTIDTLPIGDYSLVGGEHLIAVERKTLDDLIGCLSKDRTRFEKELYRGRALEYMGLVVEATLSDIINGNYYSDMNPKSVIQSLISFSVRYHLPVWLAGSREHGQRLTESLLLKYAKQLDKRCKLIG